LILNYVLCEQVPFSADKRRSTPIEARARCGIPGVNSRRRIEDGEEIIRIIPAREVSQRECRVYIQQAAG
jgi:uncharacterized DUF497 family protein